MMQSHGSLTVHSNLEAGFVPGQSDNLPNVSVEAMLYFFYHDERFNSAESRGWKQVRSGPQSYGNSAIGYVQVKREGDICTVLAKVCPEHRVRNAPYPVTVQFNEETEEVLECKCQGCAASEGTILMKMGSGCQKWTVWSGIPLSRVFMAHDCLITPDIAFIICNPIKSGPSKTKKKDPNKVDKKFLWPHGVTPPLKNVRRRRFRKTLKKKYVEAPEIEKEKRK